MSRDRDRILEQALKHELRQDAVLTPGCVDAETLGAWQDGGLAPAQMSTVEAHVSSCARCQAMLGAFARGAAALPQEPARDSGFRWFRWWLAPLAAGAAAVTLWMVVPGQQEIATRPPQPSAAATVEPFKADQITPRVESPPPAAAEPPRDATTANRANEERLRAAGASRDDRQASQQLKDADAAAAPKEQPALARREAAPAAPPAAAPAPPPVAALQEAVTVQSPATLQKRIASALEVTSPDPARRWRSVDRGVERSEDGGTTWTLVRQQAGESITAGAAPTASTCWLAGRAGLVLLTSDGTTFVRVDLPERVDITAISATDGATATVTTADGRRFRTTDSGRSWQLF